MDVEISTLPSSPKRQCCSIQPVPERYEVTINIVVTKMQVCHKIHFEPSNFVTLGVQTICKSLKVKMANDAATIIDDILNAAGPGVVLFSKSYCPYCMRAKHALMGIGIAPVVVELDERDDGGKIQVALMQRTGQRTVPSAWLAGKHIGGSDDVLAGIKSGLFKDVPAGEAKQIALDAGLQPCGKGNGIPCLCWDK